MSGNKARRRKNRIAVWVVETHPLASEFLHHILANKRRLEVKLVECGECFETLVKSNETSNPAVFLIDKDTLPIALNRYLSSIHEVFPRASVVIIGGSLPDDEIGRLHLLGVEAFVSYGDVDSELRSTIESLVDRNLRVSFRFLSRLRNRTDRLAELGVTSPHVFTPHEQDVLKLLRQRLSNKEISSVLGITERTVKFHLSNVFSKLGLHDRQSVIERLESGNLSKIPSN